MELKSLIFLLALAASSARALVLPRDPQPSSSQQSYPNSTDISVFNGQCKSHVEKRRSTAFVLWFLTSGYYFRVFCRILEGVSKCDGESH